MFRIKTNSIPCIVLNGLLVVIFLLGNFLTIENLEINIRINFFIAIAIVLTLLIKSWQNIVVLIFFIFIGTYIEPFYYYIFKGINISYHTAFASIEHLSFVLRILTAFLLTVLLSLKKIGNNADVLNNLIRFHSSNHRFIIVSVVALLMIHFFLQGNSIVVASYGSGEKMQSPLYEYTLIFIIVLATAIEHKRYRNFIIHSLILLIALKGLLFGGRITAIQSFFVAFIMFYSYKWRRKYVFIGMFSGFVLMRAFTAIRNNPALLLSSDFKISKFLFTDTEAIHTLATNQGDIAQASARILGMISTGVMDWGDRIMSFGYSVFSIFTPGLAVSPLADLSIYMKDVYGSGGGILFPVSYYAWFGYLGVIFSGLYISFVVNTYNYSRNTYLRIYSIIVIVSVFRWFGYASINPFKMCLYILPIYFFMSKVKFVKYLK